MSFIATHGALMTFDGIKRRRAHIMFVALLSVEYFWKRGVTLARRVRASTRGLRVDTDGHV